MKRTENKNKRKLCSLDQQGPGINVKDELKESVVPPPLLFRKLSNPDLAHSAGKAKLQRQLSQDDGRARHNSMASGLTGKQLLPLSNSLHSGVGQTAEPNNLVRMRNQSLGQSAPSLTAGPKELSLPRRGSLLKRRLQVKRIAQGIESQLIHGRTENCQIDCLKLWSTAIC